MPMRFLDSMLRPPYVVTAVVYAVASMALWPVPVFGLLHVESSAVIAAVAFFAAGLSSLRLLSDDEDFGPVLGRHLALLAIPWFLLTLTLLWRANCGYGQGFLLYLVYTVPSVCLGVALAYLVAAVARRRRGLWFVGIGLLVALVPVAYDLGLHPQLYSYNHVWGGLLGPLYDEELAIRPGLFFFRGLTIWWAVALVLIARRAQLRRAPGPRRAESRRVGLGLLLVAAIISGTYAAAPWLGINTPAWLIQERLGGHLELDRFDIYYDPSALSEGELTVIADAHAYRYEQLRATLGANVPIRIATYLYPDPETKAALTGSRTTSVAPTWLPTPQMHLLQDRFQSSFAHELAHVVSREFGMPVLRASPAIGLVEGLAVAVEPPDGLPSLHAQVAAALRHREDLGIYRDSLSVGVAAQLRPFGFWTGRGAVSYVTMGSFVGFLLDEYGAEYVKRAYASGNLEAAFGKSVEALAREWEHFVRQQPEDAEATALVMARFAQPGLFEIRCPHYVPPVVRHLRAARDAVERGQVDAAERAYDRALRADPNHIGAVTGWAALRLAEGDAEPALERLNAAYARRDTLWSAGLLARLGDAHRVAGNDDAADSLYAAAVARVPAYALKQRALMDARATLAPEAIQILVSPRPASERAAVLESLPGASLFAALLWAEAKEFERAGTVIEQAAGDVPPGERLAWQSGFAHAAGNRSRAAELAEASAAALEQVGAHAAADRQRDRAEMLWWLVVERGHL